MGLASPAMHCLATAATIAILLQSVFATPHTIITIPSALYARQQTDTCSIPGSKDCGITESKYCCPASTDCLPLENRTSVICCPTGSTCTKIKPITCAAAEAGSSSTTQSPPKCASGCCPVGYDCAASGTICVLRGAPKPLAPEDNGPACSKFPATSVVVGLFPGIVLGALLMALWTKFVQFHDRRRSIMSFGDAAGSPRPPPPPPSSSRNDAERTLSQTSTASSVPEPQKKLTVDIVTASHQSYSTSSDDYLRYTKSFYIEDLSPGMRSRLRSPDYPYGGLCPPPVPRRSELRVVTEEAEGEDIEIGFESREGIRYRTSPGAVTPSMNVV